MVRTELFLWSGSIERAVTPVTGSVPSSQGQHLRDGFIQEDTAQLTHRATRVLRLLPRSKSGTGHTVGLFQITLPMDTESSHVTLRHKTCAGKQGIVPPASQGMVSLHAPSAERSIAHRRLQARPARRLQCAPGAVEQRRRRRWRRRRVVCAAD